MRVTLAVLSVWLGASVLAMAEGPLGGFPPDVEPRIDGPGEILDEPLAVKVYSVADLVVQSGTTSGGGAVTIEASPLPSVTPVSVVSSQQASLENLAELSVILQSVVAPDSWEMSGGPGRVTAHGRTFSLIVRQTESCHDEISQLLDELRRAVMTEIDLSIQIYGPSQASRTPAHSPVELAPASPATDGSTTPDDVESRDAVAETNASGDSVPQSITVAEILDRFSGPLDAEQADRLRNDLRHGFETVARQSFLLQNGQSESAGAIQGAGRLRCSAVMSADRRSIRFDAGLLTDAPENGEIPFRGRILDGQTVVIPFTLTTDPTPLVAVIDARIRIPDEDEGLLEPRLVDPLPVTQQSQSSPAAVIQRTSHEISDTSRDELRAMVYPVADLLPGVIFAAGANPEQRQFELDRWAAGVARTIGRSRWTPGTSIAAHAGTLSLVVRQTGEGHRQLSDCLSRLRAAQDGVTEISVTPLSRGARRGRDESAPLSPEQVTQLLSGTKRASESLAMTVLNSPRPSVQVAPGVWLSLVPSITEDRVFVEQVTVDSESPEQTVVGRWTVPVGQSILLACEPPEDEPPVLVTIERVAAQAEEEQLLGIPGN